MDRLTSKERSWNMSRIPSKNTIPEKNVRRMLFRKGYRFRIHRSDLPGKPDIVLPKYNTVILVNGCFWHGHENCKKSSLPKSNISFWKDKIERNKERDFKNISDLKSLGWKVHVIWECETENSTNLNLILDTILS